MILPIYVDTLKPAVINLRWSDLCMRESAWNHFFHGLLLSCTCIHRHPGE